MTKRVITTGLFTIAIILSTVVGAARAGHDVEHRIALFWQRVDALQPGDYLSAGDVGQWALNVIERDPRTRITVADFRASAAGLQAAFDRAGPGPAVANPDAPIVLKVGAAVTYTTGWKVTVVRSEPQPASSSTSPSAGMQFIAVTVRYDNGTTKQDSYNAYDWKLQDSTGVRRGPAFFIGRTDKLNSGELAPGSFVQGSIVFEAPIGDARLSAIYEKYGYKLATWQLY